MIKVQALTIVTTMLLTLGVGISFAEVESNAARVSEANYTGPTGNQEVIDFFEVHEAEVRSVFRQLSSYSGVDIVVGKDVEGTVSLAVSNKTWLEIMWIVCRMNNLAAITEENYIYILSAGEYNQRRIGSAEAVEMTQSAGPLKREIIRLQFTTAQEMLGPVETFLSPRGRATVSEHNNALVLFDTEKNLLDIREMVSEMDIPATQVSISCKIVEVSSGVVQRMGIHWNITDPEFNVTASHLSPENVIPDQAVNRVTYGVLTPERFGATLEYLFEDNQGEIVAQPQITTMNNKEARIFMGQQIPLKMRDEAGNTVIQMVNAGTALTVTPHVAGDGKIMMSLQPRKESYYLLADGNPVINEQSANTNVMVRNGETVVIAGLTSNESRNTEAGIPVLKNIPILGALFKRSTKTVENNDLVIFVTPHIINADL
ncbi:hypothetical protein QA601_04615 [Chitinispirillales bacterium ANBcel5]|uniref:secretin N-terminal domain-containing protein n=1 Tax=Cellulosispirillum alkaliphilum TaxID=3039283 RepID=UPI002A582DC3|nr:hypothetical protein [Chitinispirillales bacterium ANBcel5]